MADKPTTTNTSKTIGQLLEHIDKDELILPEIQREFVWTKKAIKLLFDSLYRGLPIGHMLIWKATTAVKARPVHGRHAPKGAPISTFYGYLLDGQQRLTAIRNVRDGNENYPLMFYAYPDRESEGNEAFYWRGKNEEPDPWCIPLSEVLDERFNLTERLNAIKKDEYFKPKHEEDIRRDLTHLHDILNYHVGVIEWAADDYRLATDLFVRFNSTGRKLRSADLNLAQLAIRVPGLASDDIRKTQSAWRDFRFTAPFLVQSLLAVHTGRLRLKNPEHFWDGEDPADIRDSWKRTHKAFGDLVNFLTGTVRWPSSTLIPSFNALIPLVYIMASNGSLTAAERESARRWLLLASVHRYFSGSVQTQLDSILRRLGDRTSLKKLLGITKIAKRKLKAEDFDTSRISGPVMSLYLSFLREADARDWLHHDFRLDGTVAGNGSALQVHHFFPRALLRKRDDLRTSDINTFANYAIISAATNLDVLTEEPASYIERLKIPTSELKKQCIPLDKRLWRASRYGDFLRERRRLLAQEANTFLGF